jgi:antitoxin component of MazEF toxin-antitoxin module
MSTQLEYRKLNGLADDVSLSVVLPKTYTKALGLNKGDYVKISKQASKIMIEKAER